MSRSTSRIEAIEARLLFARSFGIDVSRYQGTINWTSTATAIDYAFIKATGSDAGNYTDRNFSVNASGAKSAGVKYGVYHFAYPDTANTTAATILSDAKSQADYFISIARTRMGSGYLPPVLDMESGDAMSTANLSLWTNDFCQEIYSTVGVKPLVYCNSNYATTQLDSSVSQWPLWIANYSSQYASVHDTTTSVPVGVGSTMGWPNNSWKFYQYGSTGTVAGISGNVDTDVFNGTTADFTNYFNSLNKPTVSVASGATTITNNQTTPINFGSTPQNATGYTLRFTISNSGTATLTTSNFAVPSGYLVTDPLATSIAAGASDTLILQQDTSTVGTFAGNVSFKTNDTSAATFSFPITGKIADVTPPTITGATFNYASATPSVSFTFSENVQASLSTSDFVFTNDTTGTTVTPSGYSYNSSTNTATLGFASALPDGNYTASVAGSGVSDAANNVMANSYALGFFALAGDVNRDRTVDILDLGVLSSHWQATGAVFADGDVNNDGTVDIVDLGILSGNWQKTLPTPAQADGLRVTALAGSAVVSTTTSKSTVVTPVKVAVPVKGKVVTTLTPISQAVLM